MKQVESLRLKWRSAPLSRSMSQKNLTIAPNFNGDAPVESATMSTSRYMGTDPYIVTPETLHNGGF